MNKVALLGRITKDFELKQAGNTPYCGFSLAVNRKFKKDGEQQADFIIVKVFGKTAEFCAKYFSKGQQVAISGRIQTGSYDGKDGQKVYTTEVIAEDVYFADSKKENKGDAYEVSPETNYSDVGVANGDTLPF
jgi:single-strand DNA-binding protein